MREKGRRIIILYIQYGTAKRKYHTDTSKSNPDGSNRLVTRELGRRRGAANLSTGEGTNTSLLTATTAAATATATAVSSCLLGAASDKVIDNRYDVISLLIGPIKSSNSQQSEQSHTWLFFVFRR